MTQNLSKLIQNYRWVHYDEIASPNITGSDWVGVSGLAVVVKFVSRTTQQKVVAGGVKGYSIHLVVDVPKSK